MPRYFAASADLVGASVLAIVAAKSLPDHRPVLQFATAAAVWLAYYLVPEWLVSATPGKLLTGLAVVRTDGRRITWGQAVVRTLTRIVEVNPFLLGAIPAAICILASREQQRLGDMLAGTVVVRRGRGRFG